MTDDRWGGAAAALLSAPVLRSAMGNDSQQLKATAAVSKLVESGFAEGAKTVRSLIWRCDRWLAKHHRSDVVFRKAIATEMLQSVGGILLPEFRIDRSKVDFLSVSDHLHAIEVKSDLDNDSRLAKQLDDYVKVAPFISIVGSERIIESVSVDLRFESVGLRWIDEGGGLQLARPAVFDTARLDSETMMRSLRRSEYLEILFRLGTPLPVLPNTLVFSAASEASRTVSPLRFYEEFIVQLRKRKPRAGLSAISKLPAPVRPAVWQLDPTIRQVSQLCQWLDKEVTYVHA